MVISWWLPLTESLLQGSTQLFWHRLFPGKHQLHGWCCRHRLFPQGVKSSLLSQAEAQQRCVNGLCRRDGWRWFSAGQLSGLKLFP